MTRPLAGIRVLDFSTLLPGPMATLLMAEAGAEVIKIERPGTGEDMRAYAPLWGESSANFALLNRGKTTLALDLKSPADRARLEPELARADVLVEQFRPGVMARLGLDYPTLSARFPRLIYCSITGYGQTGSKRDVAGHDLNYIGDTGLLALSSGGPAGPVVPPALIADIAAGAYPAMMNVLLALRARETTGTGRHLDIAMADGLFAFMYWALGAGFATGNWPGDSADLVTGGTPRYRLYPASDGRLVAAAPIEQKFWETFCDTIELDPDLREDSRDPSATVAGVAARIKSKTAAEWASVFAGKDCCCTIVATLAEAVADPHFRARGLFAHLVANETGAAIPALPVPIDPEFRGDPATALVVPRLA